MSRHEPLRVRLADNSPAARAEGIRLQRQAELQEAQEMSQKQRNDKGVVRRKPNLENANRTIDEAARAVNDALDALAVAGQREEQLGRGRDTQRTTDARRQQRGGPR